MEFAQLSVGCRRADLSVKAVLTEACHLVARDGIHPDRVLDFVNRGALRPVALDDRLTSIRNRMIKYRDQRIDFADGRVLELANLNSEARICTLDNDFRVYRLDDGQSVPLIAHF
jgi:hypothetical protein